MDHTSRFGRNQEEAIRYKRELIDLGKIVVFVSQGIISGSDRDFLSERINETLDEAYSRNLSRYVRAGFTEKAAMGHTLGHPPLGYRVQRSPSGRGAWAVPHEATMNSLLAVLRGYASGSHSFRTLALELNAQGYRTGQGGPFTESSISTILNDSFYDGVATYHARRADQEERPGAHEVPSEVKELWRHCQEVRRQRVEPGQASPRSRQQRVYPLTGVLVCDRCGRPMHGIANLFKGRAYQRMTHSWHRCEDAPMSVLCTKVEGDFARGVLANLSLDDGWREPVLRVLTEEGPQPDPSIELGRIDAAMTNLKKQHLWGAVDHKEFQAELAELRRQRREVEARILPRDAPNLDRAAQLLRDIPALWEHPGVTPEQRRELAKEIFQEIRVAKGELVAVTPRPQYAPLFAYKVWRQNQLVGGARSS